MDFSRSDENSAIEWEEFEVGGPSSNEQSPRKDSQDSNKEISQHYHEKSHAKNSSNHNRSHDIENVERAFDAPIRNISRSSITSNRYQHKKSMNGSADVSSPTKGGKEAATSRRRRDSWDNPVDDRSPQHNGQGMDVWDSNMDEEKGGGIGKLKISREMKEKLEALTSSHPVRGQKGSPSKGSGDTKQGVKKLEQHRRLMLQQQLAGGKWDSLDSVKRTVSQAPPPPVAPPNMGGISRRPVSPAPSASSVGSSAAIPQPRSPPPSIQPMGGFRSSSGAKMMAHYRGSDRRGSVSTLQTERNDQFELEESSEFLPSVDKGAPHPPGRRDEIKEVTSHLLPPLTGPHLTYSKLPWRLQIRKEVFFPGESISGDALQLVFCQVVVDGFSGATCRLTSHQRSDMRRLLESHGITPNNCLSGHHSVSVRNEVVNLAKSWPLYFAALYPVTGSRRGGEGEIVAVSHSGLRLARKEGRTLTVTNTYR